MTFLLVTTPRDGICDNQNITILKTAGDWNEIITLLDLQLSVLKKNCNHSTTCILYSYTVIAETADTQR